MTETNSQNNVNEIKRYLYGEMTEEECAVIEDKIFLEDEYFYEIENLENELIDQYVRKTLGADEIVRFEKSLGKSQERQAKVANAIALQTFIDEERKIESPILENKTTFWEKLRNFFSAKMLVLGSGMATLLIFAIIIPIFLLIIFSTQSEPPPVVKHQTPSFNSNTSKPPGNNPKPTPQASIPNVPPQKTTIMRVVFESGKDSEIVIENDLQEIEFKLLLPDSVQTGERFTVEMNKNQLSFKPVSQKDSNKQSFIIFTQKMPAFYTGKNIITVKNGSENQSFVYLFTVRMK